MDHPQDIPLIVVWNLDLRGAEKMPAFGLVKMKTNLTQVGMLYILVLWLQPVPLVEGCPAPCICHSEPRPTLACQQQGLHHIPSGIPSHTQRIFLQSNRLTVVQSTSFSSSRNLTLLWLFSNNIKYIEAGAFFGLERLEELDLGGNHLHVISPTAFQGLTKLHTLHLHRCRLSELPVGVFRGLFSLKQLFLQENNLVTLHDAMFLDLSNLTSLFLHNNNIKTVTDHLFQGLVSLDRLLLHQNKITIIQHRAFHDLQKLTTLYLFLNNLTMLSGDTMQPLVSLRYLRLNGNHWVCDCRARALLDWFKGFKGASSELECVVPARLAGKDLKQLENTDLEGCYDGAHHTWIRTFSSKKHLQWSNITQCCISEYDRSFIISSKGLPDLSSFNSRQITKNPLKEKENISKNNIKESDAIKNGKQNKQSLNNGPNILDFKPHELHISDNIFEKTLCMKNNIPDPLCAKSCGTTIDMLSLFQILLLMICLSPYFCQET